MEPIHLISLAEDALLNQFKTCISPLLYPSETDAPIEIRTLSTNVVGEAISSQDIKRIFYPNEEIQRIEWLEANRLDSHGISRFFKQQAAIITTMPDNTFWVRERYHREQAPLWRALREMFLDHLVQQKWFKVYLSNENAARADVYLAGRHLEILENPETNEIKTRPLDWFILKTYVIET
jgi:hypothetical protein